jgi:hypothetical protein
MQPLKTPPRASRQPPTRPKRPAVDAWMIGLGGVMAILLLLFILVS